MDAAWKTLGGSRVGTSHVRTATPCQDAWFAITNDDSLIVAVADGAGSASLAEVGAAIACRYAALGIAAGGDPVEAFAAARRRLAFEACVRNADLRELASTLLVAVVGPECATFAQVGDGVIVVREGDEYRPVFWPQSGEYANTTHFLTDRDWFERLEVERCEFAIDEVAVLTDGLQSLALHFATKTAHAPFFRPMFRALRRADRVETLAEAFGQFLDSEAVNGRTDDDKTLFLATRRSAHAPD